MVPCWQKVYLCWSAVCVVRNEAPSIDSQTHWHTCLAVLVSCRSGGPKEWLCSTWSAACVWTARHPPDPRLLLSVAPRWPDRPGSHRLSTDCTVGLGTSDCRRIQENTSAYLGLNKNILCCHWELFVNSSHSNLAVKKTSLRCWKAKICKVFLCTEPNLCRLLQFFYLNPRFSTTRTITVASLTFIHFCILCTERGFAFKLELRETKMHCSECVGVKQIFFCVLSQQKEWSSATFQEVRCRSTLGTLFIVFAWSDPKNVFIFCLYLIFHVNTVSKTSAGLVFV